MSEPTPTQLEAARAYRRDRAERRRETRETHRREWLTRTQIAIEELAPTFPDIRAVYVYGSIVLPRRFHAASDIDLAVVADSVESESAFWGALERRLQHDCDVRPLADPIRSAVERHGILAYEREADAAHPYD